MIIKYLALAKIEFHDAISHYENEQRGLGKKFESDIKSSLTRIKNFPTSYIKVEKDIRKCILHKFPYNIIFSIEEDYILIIAVAHHHRKPDYWVHRIK